MRTDPKRNIDLAAALKSFSGYLQGSGKAEHTIRNYRWDILHFARYLAPPGGPDALRRLKLSNLTPADLEGYDAYLRSRGFKTNTRRRRLITVGRFLSFLAGRRKLPEELGRKMPAPHKMERVPFTISATELLNTIRRLPYDTELTARNRALLWALAETACSVSELARVRFEDVAVLENGKGSLRIEGKSARTLEVSQELAEAILVLRKGEVPWVFRGWNKYRALPTAITPRGIELLVRSYAEKLLGPAAPSGDQDLLTPRTFRHSAVIRWYQEGVSREEIQKRLGLKTAYAFRIYEPLFKSSSKTTSSSEKPPGES